MKNKLVVIPSDPISAYEAKGTSSWLKDYYNPNSFFEEVYVLSPLEKEYRKVYGLNIIPIKSDKHFKKELQRISPLCVRAYGGYWATDYANYNRVVGIPVVSSVHDTNPQLIHDSLKFSDFIFVMSNVIENILLDNHLAKKKYIGILGNRVNTALFSQKKTNNSILSNYGIHLNKKIILHVGRKTHQKNIDNVLKSLLYLNNDFILVLIGKGEFDEYSMLIKNLELDDRVFNIEKIENNELLLFYNLANVLCAPSRWEGFGLVFAEAASCLTKIVTSNIAPMNEYLINDGVMNVLIDDYENPKSIAHSILEIDNSFSINNNTRDIITKRFDEKIVSQKEVDFYKKVIYNNKTKEIDYKIWYFKRWLKYVLLPQIIKIKKLPKRLWKKILSYL